MPDTTRAPEPKPHVVLKEHESVITTEPLWGGDRQEHRYPAGTVGTIVHVYRNAEAYEVEFSNPPSVVTVNPDEIRSVQP